MLLDQLKAWFDQGTDKLWALIEKAAVQHRDLPSLLLARSLLYPLYYKSIPSRCLTKGLGYPYHCNYRWPSEDPKKIFHYTYTNTVSDPFPFGSLHGSVITFLPKMISTQIPIWLPLIRLYVIFILNFQILNTMCLWMYGTICPLKKCSLKVFHGFIGPSNTRVDSLKLPTCLTEKGT